MEFGVRDWMIIIGVLLIVVVLLDGFRRMRNERRGNIRIALNKQFLNSVDDEPLSNSELPTGVARIVDRDSVLNRDNTPELGDGNLTNSGLDFDQSVPMLMESVIEKQAEHTLHYDDDSDPLFSSKPKEKQQPNSPSESDEEFEIDATDPASEDGSSESQWSVDDKEVIVINVQAKDQPFKGPDLLHILLACDLRFGDLNIFHRHEDANGCGAVQFSMTNSVEPGFFDLDTIDDFTTPGVCFFMSVPGPKEPIKAFECMVETAQCLVTNLQGELLDESRSAMTNQTLEHCRLRLQEFERRQLAQHV
jgi:cell division protein ZipA